MPPLPTILAFHGGGSNATIHTVQLARLNRLLRPHFDILSLEAPFPSAAGPGILPFFEGCGPYKRWIPPTDTSTQRTAGGAAEVAGSLMAPAVEKVVLDAVKEVNSGGGRVVGVVGFSQGTRMVAGILLAKQIFETVDAKCPDSSLEEFAWLEDVQFGLSICGSYPPPLLPPSVYNWAKSVLDTATVDELVKQKITVPCCHVQGRMDEWEWAGRLLIDGCYVQGEGRSLVLELEIGHFYPTRVEDNEGVFGWVRGVMGMEGK